MKQKSLLVKALKIYFKRPKWYMMRPGKRNFLHLSSCIVLENVTANLHLPLPFHHSSKLHKRCTINCPTAGQIQCSFWSYLYYWASLLSIVLSRKIKIGSIILWMMLHYFKYLNYFLFCKISFEVCYKYIKSNTRKNVIYVCLNMLLKYMHWDF